jgi:20S proteasome alpha/beta subunit
LTYCRNKRYNPPLYNKKYEEDIEMTVCVATISESSNIIGISDRMITYGDIQFEPNTSKIVPITKSIIAMTAGDLAFQTEILNRMIGIISMQYTSQPINHSVEDIANLYLECKKISDVKKCENIVLAPFGLTYSAFLDKQLSLQENFVLSLKNEIQQFRYQLPKIETIITGVDKTGPHIYVIDGDNIHCCDKIGFATIGGGSRHASSQLMLAGYNFDYELSESLLLTYNAKKRAEVAPGVGKGSDMFMIESEDSCFFINNNIIKNLEKTYKNIVRLENSNYKKAKNGIYSYLEKIRTGEN